MTSEMLLRLGHEKDAAGSSCSGTRRYQFANGKVPCCVDRRGADPVPENDSTGEFLFLIDSVYRYTGDVQLLRQLWPATSQSGCSTWTSCVCRSALAANTQGDRKAFYGLMPASISHEGYSAKPMHSYWDDFWALAGYESAIRIARALGETDQMHAFIESRDQFRRDLYRLAQHCDADARHRLPAGLGRARRLRCDLDVDRVVAGRRAADVAAGGAASRRSSATGRDFARGARTTRRGMHTHHTSGATSARSSACAGATAAWS